MASHSLYPGFVKLHYTSNTHPHVMVLPVIPGLVGSVWTVSKVLGGVYNPWTDAIDAFVIILKALLNTADTIDSADLYQLASPTSVPVFRSTYLIGVNGTQSTATVPWEQMVWTFRNDDGGHLKVYLMEGVFPLNYRKTYSAAGSTAVALFDFVMSGAGFIFSRDEGIPIAPIFVTTKENDALRKRYLLDA